MIKETLLSCLLSFQHGFLASFTELAMTFLLPSETYVQLDSCWLTPKQKMMGHLARLVVVVAVTKLYSWIGHSTL